jgi:hypothetical protein
VLPESFCVFFYFVAAMSPRFPTPREVKSATSTWKQQMANIEKEVQLINTIIGFLRSCLKQEATIDSLKEYLQTLQVDYSEYMLKERMAHLPWSQYFRIRHKDIELYTGDYSQMAMVQLISRDLVSTKQQDAWIERLDPLGNTH